MASRRRLAQGCSGLIIALVGAACGGPVHPAPAPHGVGEHDVALLPGITRTSLPAPQITALEVTPAASITDVHAAPFERTAVRTATRAVVNMPVTTHVRPLLVSAQTLRAGASITAVAPGLGTGRQHDALFVLQGPQLRAERLVQIRDGVAAGVVHLPPSMAAGTWTLGAEDLSGIESDGAHKVRGTALFDAGVFTVPAAPAVAANLVPAMRDVAALLPLPATEATSTSPIQSPQVQADATALCQTEATEELRFWDPTRGGADPVTLTGVSFAAAEPVVDRALGAERDGLRGLRASGSDVDTLRVLSGAVDREIGARSALAQGVLLDGPLDLDTPPAAQAGLVQALRQAYVATDQVFLAAGLPGCATPLWVPVFGHPGTSEATGASWTDRITAGCATVTVQFEDTKLRPPATKTLQLKVGGRPTRYDGTPYGGDAGPLEFVPDGSDVVFVHTSYQVVTGLTCSGAQGRSGSGSTEKVECHAPAEASLGHEVKSFPKAGVSSIPVPGAQLQLPYRLGAKVAVSISVGKLDLCQDWITGNGYHGPEGTAALTLDSVTTQDNASHGPFAFSFDQPRWSSTADAPTDQTFVAKADAASVEFSASPQFVIDGSGPAFDIASLTFSLTPLSVTLVHDSRAVLKATVGASFIASVEISQSDLEKEVENITNEDSSTNPTQDELANAEKIAAEEETAADTAALQEELTQFYGVDASLVQTQVQTFALDLDNALLVGLGDDAVLAAIPATLVTDAGVEATFAAGDAAVVDGVAVDASIDIGAADLVVFLVLL